MYIVQVLAVGQYGTYRYTHPVGLNFEALQQSRSRFSRQEIQEWSRTSSGE